jgi:S1-C subfamily serine protease
LLPSVPQLEFQECELDEKVLAEVVRVPGLQMISLVRCRYKPDEVFQLLEARPGLIVSATGHDAFLGVSVQANLLVDADSGEETLVCEVQTVVPGSAAAESGLQVGDSLLEIDGHRVSDYYHLIICIACRHPGDEVRLKYISNGEEHLKTVVLRERPPDEQRP